MDLANREEALAATLHVKDEEVEGLIAQRTQELKQRHKEALNAQALVHDDKVKEMEVERDDLKSKALELAKEKDTISCASTEAQAAVLDKVELLSQANGSIKDLKLKLEGLEGMLSEVKTREETLTNNLEKERQLRRNDAANHEDYVKGKNLQISRLADVTGRITMKLANTGMPNVRYALEPNVSPNTKLTLFFKGVLGALE